MRRKRLSPYPAPLDRVPPSVAAALTGGGGAVAAGVAGIDRNHRTADDTIQSAENVTISASDAFTMLAWVDPRATGGSSRQVVLAYGENGGAVGAGMQFRSLLQRVELFARRADGTAVSALITEPAPTYSRGPRMMAAKVVDTGGAGFVRGGIGTGPGAFQWSSSIMVGGVGAGTGGPISLCWRPDLTLTAGGYVGGMAVAVIEGELSDAAVEAYAAQGVAGIAAAVADHGARFHYVPPSGADGDPITTAGTDSTSNYTMALGTQTNRLTLWDGT